LAVLAFLLVSATASTRAGRRAEEPRKAALISEIVKRRSTVNDLDQAVGQLRQSVTDAQRANAARSRSDRDEAERTALLAQMAGTTALKGPAVIVRLTDSSQPPPAGTSDAGAYTIHDSDLQLVVNALFAAGAEAVAINDNRIVATTPIRAAGGTIVVNFRPVPSPYRVVGIGASKGRFDDSEIAHRFKQWSKQFGLGFNLSESRSATVPAYTGRVAIDDATPSGG
jgi:uncharacterized protein YlxW (UPF0749 family)